LGVFGGTAGLHLLSELSRGAVGCMPSAAMPKYIVKIYNEYLLGNIDTARSLYRDILPLLNMEMSLLMGVSKAILLRNKVFTTTNLRDPEFTVLDNKDLEEIDAIFAYLEKERIREGDCEDK
jgi:dihydrodipicolinate synthase/N-acetylneuraminate lyase